MTWTTAWKALAEQVGSEPGWHTRRIYPESSCDLRAGIHMPDRTPGLILELPGSFVSTRIQLPQSKGVQHRIESLEPGPAGKKQIILQPRTSAYQGVFQVLAEDISQKIAACTELRMVYRTIAARLRVWQQFFKNADGGLSDAEIQGLFGELTVLQDLLLPAAHPADVLDAWKGPDGGVHDFRFPRLALEVKSTVRHPPDSFTVSNLAQLHQEAVGTLFLCHVALVRDHPEGISLNRLVERVTEALATDQEASALFHDQLLKAGYLAEDNSRFDAYVFHKLHLIAFEVAETFPRLTPADVPQGILDASYQISYAALSPFKVALSTVAAAISREAPQHG